MLIWSKIRMLLLLLLSDWEFVDLGDGDVVVLVVSDDADLLVTRDDCLWTIGYE